MKTFLIDYGSGNLRSCAKSLEAAGFGTNPHELIVSNNPELARDADALVLPGQGHFRQVMESFLESGFEQVVRDHIAAGKAFLGICVGMQILFDRSEESNLPGLGVIPGEIKRFPKPIETSSLEKPSLEKPGLEKPSLEKLSVPQMQWNTLEPVGDSPLMRGLGNQPFAYFVHSYYAPISVAQNGARTNYGLDFLSVVSVGNVHATQFHPEKSQRVGLRILENFRDWAAQHEST